MSAPSSRLRRGRTRTRRHSLPPCPRRFQKYPFNESEGNTVWAFDWYVCVFLGLHPAQLKLSTAVGLWLCP